jgi:hypothetical protein
LRAIKHSDVPSKIYKNMADDSEKSEKDRMYPKLHFVYLQNASKKINGFVFHPDYPEQEIEAVKNYPLYDPQHQRLERYYCLPASRRITAFKGEGRFGDKG